MSIIERSSKPWSLFASSHFNSPAGRFYATWPSIYEPLPCAGKEDEKIITSDEFRMFEFKIRKCTKSRSHDWTDCPYAHHGEKARRRDPRIYPYSGIACPEFRKGKCGKGMHCEFAHGIFEFWLHPSKYRTRLCKDAGDCRRKVCFFAHSAKELRSPPETNGCQCSCSSCRRSTPVVPSDFSDLISYLRKLQSEESGSRVRGSYGEEAVLPETDFGWVSELVK